MSYTNLTELPDDDVPLEQLFRIEQRYSFSAKYSKNRDILEIGCGPGIGSNLLSNQAKSYFGIDIDEQLINLAKKNNSSINYEQIDEKKFFEKNSKKFDLIVIYETIYYIKNLNNLFNQIHKSLNDDGILIICTANKNLLDFNPSIKTFLYPDILDIKKLSENKFKIDSYCGGIPTDKVSFRQKLLRPIKFFASRLKLIPKDMKNKKFLKKIFFGKNFVKLPKNVKLNINSLNEINNLDEKTKDYKHKVLYFVLRKIN